VVLGKIQLMSQNVVSGKLQIYNIVVTSFHPVCIIEVNVTWLDLLIEGVYFNGLLNFSGFKLEIILY